MQLKQHLESKTVFGFLLLLGTTVGLALAGHLSDQVVECIKYLGGFFMGVRTTANIMENIGKSVDGGDDSK